MKGKNLTKHNNNKAKMIQPFMLKIFSSTLPIKQSWGLWGLITQYIYSCLGKSMLCVLALLLTFKRIYSNLWVAWLTSQASQNFHSFKLFLFVKSTLVDKCWLQSVLFSETHMLTSRGKFRTLYWSKSSYQFTL